MFQVGDIVRCVESRSDQGGRPHIRGLMFFQRFEVSRVKNWPDGSQSLWVKASPRDPKRQAGGSRQIDLGERGPYCHLRFSLEEKGYSMNDYDPTQMGDTDDDI
jgi:hypothetical protein